MAVDGLFLGGVVEGFYGQPWSTAERFELFDWLERWWLNGYLYATKDDLKHRAIWRELYTAEEMQALRELIRRSHRGNIRFIYALAPGLDIQYSSAAESEAIKHRFNQLLGVGCEHF